MGEPQLDVSGRPVRLREVDLDRFFDPRTIAVVGATDNERSGAFMSWRQVLGWCQRNGVAVHPINSGRDQVDGLRAWPSLLDVPDEIDVAIVLVGDAEAVLDEAIEKKASFAVVFGAGFAEAGPEGRERQAALERRLATSDLHLLGPNTTLNAFQDFRTDLPGRRIALITQSGHQGRPIYQGQELGIALSHWAPTGNEADLEAADFVRYFADQADVGAIAAYIDGFKDGRTLMLAADHAANKGVPLVVVKVGRTDLGRSWARSHSGHLAGTDAVMSAVFRQFGVTRVDHLDELLDLSAMFARCPEPTGDGVCIYSISGGTGAHMADLASAAGLRLPELAQRTQDRLHEWIAPFLRVSNPVDSGGHPTADWRGPRILEAILADPAVDLLVVPIVGSFSPISEKFAQDLVDAAGTTDKPIVVVWGSPVGDEEAYRDILLRSSLPVFRSARNALAAVKAWLDYHQFRASYRSPFDRPVLRARPQARRARASLRPGQSLSELDAKAMLADYGIAVTRDVLCTSPAEAVRAAEGLGYPVVLKACSAALEHKADRGLVEVGIASARAVRDSYRRLADRAEQVVAGEVDGVLVCEQVTGGVETIVGVVQDELFGPTLLFGIGGVAVEVYRDVAFRVPPFDRHEARRMIEEVRGLPLLRGWRGRPAADLGALVTTIMRVQRLAMDLADDLEELDVNPLVALPRGAVALDALAVGRRR